MLTTAAGTGSQRATSGFLLAVMVAVASRQYGPRDAGVIAVATTVVLIAITLADFGTTPMAMGEFARQAPTRREFRGLMTVKTWLALGDPSLEGVYRDRFTGLRVVTERRDGGPALTAGSLFGAFPVADVMISLTLRMISLSCSTG